MPDMTITGLAVETARHAARQVELSLGDSPLGGSVLAVLDGFTAAAFAHEPARLPAAALIPALIHAGRTGEVEPAMALCGSTLLLFLGIDLLDDVMDGDRTAYWQAPSSAEGLLVASTLLMLPHLEFARAGKCATDRSALHATLANGLARMAVGQQADLATRDKYETDPSAILGIVAGKSGEMTAMVARLGGLIASGSDEQVDAYADWGLAYGIADQLRTDCADLFHEPHGSDLAARTVTYPLAQLVHQAPAAERPGLTALIRAAAHEPSALVTLRSMLKERGVIAITEVQIRWYEAQARAALERAAPQEPAASALRALMT